MGSGLGTGGATWQATPHATLLDSARKAVTAVAAAGTHGLEPDHLRRHLREVSGLISSLELLRARDVRELESADAADLVGATSMVDFLSLECGLMPEAAKDRVLLGRQLDALSATAQGLESGKLSLDTAALVARTASAVQPEKAAQVESGILEASERLAPANLRREAEKIRARVDATSFETAAERAFRMRALRLGPDREGLVSISGSLTSLAAAHLRSELAPYMKPRDATDKRTAEQRRHDALEIVCQVGGKSHVQIVAPVEAITGDGPAAALLEGLLPLSRADLNRAIEGGASLSAVLKDARGKVLLAGRARNLTPAQRRVLVAVNPTCVFSGCSRPAVESQPHHLTEHCRGGKTGIQTQAPLCPAHQLRVHRDGWWVRSDGKGGYETLPPEHPENPPDRLSPGEYRQRVEAARRERKQRRERRARDQTPAAPTGLGP